MYEIHFRKRWDDPRDYLRVAWDIPSLSVAMAARVVSGDIVVHAKTLIPVKSDKWLWLWEKEDPTCCAYKAMQSGMTQKEVDALWATQRNRLHATT